MDTPSRPPPSYWIGLSRPPPAPNWQRFSNDLGRNRPPPKPNWPISSHPPPTPSWQTHPMFATLPSPPFYTKRPQSVLPSSLRLAMSSILPSAPISNVLLALLMEVTIVLFPSRRGNVLGFLWLFYCGRTFDKHSFVLWVSWQMIPLTFSRSFATWILWLKDPPRSFSTLVTNLPALTTGLFLWDSLSFGVLFGVFQFFGYLFTPLWILLACLNASNSRELFFLSDSLILSSSKSGGVIGYDRLRILMVRVLS
jgi:hypothetical protein